MVSYIFTVSIKIVSSQYKHCNVKPVNGEEFDCMFVYGFNDPNSRMELWSGLKLISRDDIPWIILGDFDALSSIEDGVGVVVRQTEITPMLECSMAYNWTDVKATGRYFTLTNKQDCEQRVFSRIDKVVANSK